MALRADAEENKRLIIDAAAVVFAHQGIEAPMSEVARRARVGAATLSRRFASKDELIDAVFERDLHWWLEAVQGASRADDSWGALISLLKEACSQQARSTACADLVVRSFLHGNRFRSEREQVKNAVESIIREAQTARRADPDLAWDDLVILLEANAGVVSRSSTSSEARTRRLVHHFICSFSR